MYVYNLYPYYAKHAKLNKSTGIIRMCVLIENLIQSWVNSTNASTILISPFDSEQKTTKSTLGHSPNDNDVKDDKRENNLQISFGLTSPIYFQCTYPQRNVIWDIRRNTNIHIGLGKK